MTLSEPSLARFRSVVEAALAQLEERRREVNDLNVFPVADGDTGDNMALTLRAVLAELDRLGGDGERPIDEIGREEIVDSVARAALLRARGNSGVILSQLIRGAAEGTILTVVREMAHRIASELAHMPDTRLGPDAPAQVQDAAIAQVLEP